MHAVLLPLISVIIFGVAESARVLNSTINPDCPIGDCSTYGSAPWYNNLVYTVSNDSSDSNAKSYRIFWSTIGAPTLLITEVDGNTTTRPSILWMEYMQDRTPQMPFLHLWDARYSAVVLSKLIEFNDVNDTAQLDKAQNWTVHDLSAASWYNVSITNLTGGGVLATFTGTYGDQKNNIILEVRAQPTDSRADLPPRMLVSASSTSLRVILSNQTTSWERSRFALEIIFASNDSSRLVAAHSETKQVSDEYSPGVFTIEEISGRDTYLQWKPIVYTKISAGVSDSTRSSTSRLISYNVTEPFKNQSFPYSLLQCLAGLLDADATLVRFNITLGLPGDDFYAASNYQEWSCELGLGQPRVEATSSNVKTIIAVGFGVPAALILFGAIYVCYIRAKRRRHENQARLITETTTTYRTLD